MKRTADQKRVIGYVRVSTDAQELGPEAQREQLERWCHAHGAELVAVHSDLGLSGAVPVDKRPGLLAALDELRTRNAGVLLVAKRDRLARDVVVAAMIERLAEREGARVLSADGASDSDGPEGMLLRGIADLFAQYERAMIRTRTRAALAVKRTRGERTGEIPYGYALADDGIHLDPHPTEQRVIQSVRELRAQGLSLRAISDRLNAEAVQARGERWYPMTVSRIVARVG